MRFARWAFLISAIYGLIVTTPLFFLEQRIAQDAPPAITHPEFFYGFASLVIAWQIMFLLIASDPLRYRPAMLVGVVEKMSFVIPVPILFMLGRVQPSALAFAMLDGVQAILFAIAY